MAVLSERCHDRLAMVALQLDHPILDGSARTAGRAQLLAQQGHRNRIERQPPDQGHALAAPAPGLARHAHHAVACGRGPGLADALRECPPAFGTHASGIGRVHKAAF